MSKHTRKPWFVAQANISENSFFGVHGGDEREFIICDLCDDGYDKETQRANADLIAAAPELLEALKAVIAISDRKHDAWDTAKAVIAKAEGKQP